MASKFACVIESELELMRGENGFQEIAVVEGEGLLRTRDDDEHVDVCEVCEFCGVDAAHVKRVELLPLLSSALLPPSHSLQSRFQRRAHHNQQLLIFFHRREVLSRDESER